MRYCPQCRAELSPQTIDNTRRTACSAQCGFVHWDNPTPVVAAIVEYEGQVLLARNAKWPQGWFALITGFLERGETPEQGVLREVEEELGLRGEIAEFVGNYSFIEQNQLLIVFHIVAHGTVQLNEELAEYKLQPHAEVKPWPLGTGLALRDWLQRRRDNRQ
ncbi:MAG TPA: NUDIX domain-containing protein [Spongiibacteraceae bacterium]